MNATLWTMLLVSAAPVVNPVKTKIDAAMPVWLERSEVPSAAVALIGRGKVRWTAAYGEARPGVSATTETLYNVASMTKPLAAEAILRLAARRHLDLDEPLHKSWIDPDVADDPRHRKLTPRIALSHRTGFPNWRRQNKDGRLGFRSDPGLRPGYSGEGYEYVARFVQNKLGLDFEAVVHREVLAPLGMTRTALSRKPWFDKTVIAMPKGPDGSRRAPDIRNAWSAADDAHTTIGDYARFVTAVMAHRDLTTHIADERWRVGIPQFRERCPWKVACPKSVGFGLGWAVFDYGKERVILQGGADWGERAIALFIPEREVGLVVMTNSASGGRVILEVVKAAIDHPAFHRFVEFQAR